MRSSWRLAMHAQVCPQALPDQALAVSVGPVLSGAVRNVKVNLPSCVLSQLLVQRHLLARAAGPGLLGRRTIPPHPQDEQGVHQSMSGRLFERHATRGTIDSKYCNPGTLTSVSQDNSTQKRVRCSLCEVR